MAAGPDRLALFEEMREDELDAAALYRALADASQGRRRDVLNRLAEAEERHAGHWERLLRDAGITDFPPLKRTLRTRLLSTMAHRFGADSVLPLVLRLEAADAAKYRGVAEAPETMSAEEMAHGRAVAALGGGGKGEQIARSEGRHRAAAGGALRAGVFGVNDGLVSNLLLILGVAGGTSNHNIILLAGLAGLLAGAFSMASGEWVSVQSQRELYEREISVEREELKAFPEEELDELDPHLPGQRALRGRGQGPGRADHAPAGERPRHPHPGGARPRPGRPGVPLGGGRVVLRLLRHRGLRPRHPVPGRGGDGGAGGGGRPLRRHPPGGRIRRSDS